MITNRSLVDSVNAIHWQCSIHCINFCFSIVVRHCTLDMFDLLDLNFRNVTCKALLEFSISLSAYLRV